jgi:uncharacterized membrane protein
MEFLALIAIGAVISIMVVPWIAMSKASRAESRAFRLEKELQGLAKRLNDAVAQIASLQSLVRDLKREHQQPDISRSPFALAPDDDILDKNANSQAESAPIKPFVSPPPQSNVTPPIAAQTASTVGSTSSPIIKREATKQAPVQQRSTELPTTSTNVSKATEDAKSALEDVAEAPKKKPLADDLTISEWSLHSDAQPASSRAPNTTSASNANSGIKTSSARPAAPARQPARVAPSAPSDFELQIKQWITAGKEWLFGGNLVAKVGLLILFIGVAFLVRLASTYYTMPVPYRLALAAAGAIALLVWGWRIRETRRGIALPAQGAALAILMLITFGAFKRFDLLPAGTTFAMLFVLVAFTCILAVLQDAVWLAAFGIAGGFAAPILTSTGSGNHIALFSYYSLLNAGVLAIALKRSWRALNLLGFAFTFIVGATWGEMRYEPSNYLSSQLFLIAFWLFYIVIAILYAHRRAPQLKSYVDGTLVFGVPMAGMALQYGLVKNIEYGMSFSALAIALTYTLTATLLWRWRRGNLRLLVESFLALGVVFGTLAIPLAFDGRWTSAAWAVEGAAIVWVGLRQKQKLAWRFGIAVQFGSWISFMSSLSGLDPVSALKENLGLGFAVLGITGVLMALLFRNPEMGKGTDDDGLDDRDRRRFTWFANTFISFAVVWLLLGMWVEVWLRLTGAPRASMLVATALGLVVGLNLLAKKSTWQLPTALGGAVGSIAGVLFALLMFQHMEWHNVTTYAEQSLGELLRQGSLLGGLMLCGGALVSAFGFKNRIAEMQGTAEQSARTTIIWLMLAVFWWCGFVLHGVSHAIAYLTSRDATAWYSVSFWSAYSIGLCISGLAWTTLAMRKQFAPPRWLLFTFWPAITIAGAFLYWLQINDQLQWLNGHWNQAPVVADNPWIRLLAGPLFGALILCSLAWYSVFKLARTDIPSEKKHSDTATRETKAVAIAMWILGFGAVWYSVVVDALSLYIDNELQLLGAPSTHAFWQLRYEQVILLLTVLSSMAFLRLAKRTQLLTLRWLTLPAVIAQLFASISVLGTMYLGAELPSIQTGVALAICWLGVAWGLRYWQDNEWNAPSWCLAFLHISRVIAPWLAVAPLISLGTWPWLMGVTYAPSTDAEWVVSGMWPDYLAAWVSIATLFILLRQAKHEGWPLRPLQSWYTRQLIPIAALWAVLLAIYWNLRQNGNMSPLPYLPILNPLDITTGFIALLVIAVWRANKDIIGAGLRLFGIKVAMALSFAWFNAMLLRTAANYLDIPYRFNALYASQFIQAMLSIVWTLTALFLMRFAVRKLSKPLWMVGATLLGVVVGKLFWVDLANSGSVARVVSFVSVGVLMIAIGYIAPFPKEKAQGDAE